MFEQTTQLQNEKGNAVLQVEREVKGDGVTRMEWRNLTSTKYTLGQVSTPRTKDDLPTREQALTHLRRQRQAWSLYADYITSRFRIVVELYQRGTGTPSQMVVE